MVAVKVAFATFEINSVVYLNSTAEQVYLELKAVVHHDSLLPVESYHATPLSFELLVVEYFVVSIYFAIDFVVPFERLVYYLSIAY